jgi:glycosyltransferase involved in cell wall biosynthesis
VRDDGSTDGTPEILDEFQKKYPKKMTIIPGDKRLGVKGNFSSLMQHSTAPYIMFCDQDDVWFSNKIKMSLEVIKNTEKEFGQIPILIHTDLTVADKNLTPISKSYFQYVGINPELNTLNRVVVQNTVTGCTMMINRPLLELIKHIPEEAVMHDWWIALTAGAFGKIVHIPKSTMLYRQHENNDVGATPFSLKQMTTEMSDILFSKQKHKAFRTREDARKQAKAFLSNFQNLLKDDQATMLNDFSRENDNWFDKRRTLLKHGLLKHGLVRNLFTFLVNP